MASGKEALYLPAPYGGIDVSVAPHMLDANKTPKGINWLVHQDGKMPLRGGRIWKAKAVNYSTLAGVSTALAVGSDGIVDMVEFSPAIALVTILNDAASSACPPWRQFERTTAGFAEPARIAALNRSDAGALSYASDPTATGVPGPGPYHAYYKGRLYYYPYPYTGAGVAVDWNGKLHMPVALYSYGYPGPGPLVHGAVGVPRGSGGMCVFAERLFVAGGVHEVLAGPYKPNTLIHTNPDQDPAVAANWITGGIANVITIGQETPNDWIVGIKPTEKYMLICKRNSTWTLTGSGPDSWTVRQVSNVIGCVDPRSMCVVGSTIYFMSDTGLYRYDGYDLAKVSGPVEALLATHLRFVQRTFPNDYTVHVTDMHNDYLYITIGQQIFSSSASDRSFINQCWLYHMPSGRWMLYHEGPFDVDFPQSGYSMGPVSTVKFGSHRVAWRGWDFLDFDAVTEPDATDWVSFGYARQHDLLEGATGSSNKWLIPMNMYFRPVRAQAPSMRMNIQRVGLEMKFYGPGGISSGAAPRLSLRRYARDYDGELTANDLTSLVNLQPSFLAPNEVGSVQAWDRVQGGEYTDFLPEIHHSGVGVGEDASQIDKIELVGAQVEFATPTHMRS